jgi:hypothetical protein
MGAARGAEAGGAVMGTRRYARNPITGEEIAAWATQELDSQLNEIVNFPCKHARAIACVPTSNGATQIWEYCTLCGQKFASPKPRRDFAIAPETIDVSNIQRKYDDGQALRKYECVKLAADFEKKNELAEGSEYRKYLKSEAWKAKREKVLDRANNWCEGCRERPAEEVHHLTYEHRFYEFLFELVALCPPCHSLIHYKENPELRSSDLASEENCLCIACRWQSSQNGHIWCSIYEMPGLSALRSEDKCRDGADGFEGLK